MKDIEKLRGTGVAVVTPFDGHGNIDLVSLDNIVKHLLNGDVNYLVALGTTAETSTLTLAEKKLVLNQITASAAGKVPVVLGVGGNNTHQVLQDLEEMIVDNVDAVLSVSPYYNRPSQEGIIQHFNTIANESSRPIILYNVSPRTGVNMDSKTTLALADHENIIGIKDATADLAQINDIIMHKPKDFMVISGEDSQAFHTMCLGGDGVISVIGNLLPKKVSTMIDALLHHRLDEARACNQYLTPFFDLITKEGNPTSIKAGLAAKALCTVNVRLPLVSASNGLKEAFQKLL